MDVSEKIDKFCVEMELRRQQYRDEAETPKQPRMVDAHARIDPPKVETSAAGTLAGVVEDDENF